MAVQQRPVHVVGVGMIPFTKPGASESYNTMGRAQPSWRWTMPACLTTRCSKPMWAMCTATPPPGKPPFTAWA